MKNKKVIEFILFSVLAGMVIGLGGLANLLANNLQPGLEGRLSGGLLFALGIFAIISFEKRLFTGLACNLSTYKKENIWHLPVSFLANSVGVGITVFLARFTPIGDTMALQSTMVIQTKFAVDSWVLSALCSSMLCGILIALSIWSATYAPKKGLSATLGVMLPIVVFAFCGFDHSVANMIYFFYNGAISLEILCYILLTIMGNLIGCALMPLIIHYREKDKHANNE